MPLLKLKSLMIGLLAGALFLQGCGWHLRGAQPLPPELQTLFLQVASENSSFARSLKRSLKSMDVQLADQNTGAPYSLVVSDVNRTTRTISTTSAAKVAEYALTSSINFSVKNQQGETLIPQTLLSVEKSYLYNSNNAVSSYEEEALLRREMERDLVQQLIRRYRAIKPTTETTDTGAETN